MPRTNPINVRVSDEEKRIWEEFAKRHGVPLTVIIRNSMNACVQGIVKLPSFVPVPKASADLHPAA